MIRNLFILGFLLGCVTITSAQDYVELGQAGYRYSFRTKGNEGQEGRTIQGWRLNAMLPVKISANTYLLPGFRFWQYDVQPGEDLRLYFFQVGMQTQINDTWDLQFIPILRSGISTGTSFADGLQFGVLTVAHQKRSEHLTLGYGFYTNHEQFGQLLTPVLGIDWQINERWRLFGNFPMYTTIAYRINERWNTGIHYIGLVTSFKSGDKYVERQSLDFSGFLEYYVTPQLVAQVKLGYPADRKYEVYDEDDKVNFSLSIIRFGDDRELLESFDDTNLFVTLNLLFRVSP